MVSIPHIGTGVVTVCAFHRKLRGSRQGAGGELVAVYISQTEYMLAENYSILSLSIATELDIVAARNRARQIAGLAGLSPRDQARIATAVSELTRNIISGSGMGTVQFAVACRLTQALRVSVVEPRGDRIDSDIDVMVGVQRLVANCSVYMDGADGLTTVLEVPIPSDRPPL